MTVIMMSVERISSLRVMCVMVMLLLIEHISSVEFMVMMAAINYHTN